jgi:peptide chain release factor 1
MASMRCGTVFDLELVDERPGIAILQVTGKNASKLFANESGGHRWQRVPPNEKKGRVHTSTVTVAVLRVPTDRDMTIADKDLRWTFCRSGGSGGQHVNKTESAVQLLHIPTGLMVRCESERSQTQNKVTAKMLMLARLAEAQDAEVSKATAASRKAQVGVGARGDKRRTIRTQDGIVTDHLLDQKWPLKSYLRGEW